MGVVSIRKVDAEDRQHTCITVIDIGDETGKHTCTQVSLETFSAYHWPMVSSHLL